MGVQTHPAEVGPRLGPHCIKRDNFNNFKRKWRTGCPPTSTYHRLTSGKDAAGNEPMFGRTLSRSLQGPPCGKVAATRQRRCATTGLGSKPKLEESAPEQFAAQRRAPLPASACWRSRLPAASADSSLSVQPVVLLLPLEAGRQANPGLAADLRLRNPIRPPLPNKRLLGVETFIVLRSSQPGKSGAESSSSKRSSFGCPGLTPISQTDFHFHVLEPGQAAASS